MWCGILIHNADGKGRASLSFVAGKTHILGMKCGGTLEKVNEFQLYVEGSGFGSAEARVLILFLNSELLSPFLSDGNLSNSQAVIPERCDLQGDQGG